MTIRLAPALGSMLPGTARVRLAAFAAFAALLAPPPAPAQAPAAAPGTLQQQITSLGAADYAVRTQAARLIRRTDVKQAVPALAEAARRDGNEFVRYRALVLLTAFNDPGTREVMSGLLRDPNDRVREVAFKWLEDRPDPRLAATLVPLLQTEQAEFVRPALIGALAAIGTEPAVQRALTIETTRGFDFFRSAVIDAMGRHRAVYGLDGIVAASRLEGPLQDDAVLALGRIGGTRAAAVLKAMSDGTPEAMVMLHAARCLAGDPCAERVRALAAIATSEDAPAGDARAAVNALGALGQGRVAEALAALLTLSDRRSALRERVSIAMGTVAIRQPDWTVGWLEGLPASARDGALALLKDGFDNLEEDYAEERFFAETRAGYWRAGEGSAGRTLRETIIQRLEF